MMSHSVSNNTPMGLVCLFVCSNSDPWQSMGISVLFHTCVYQILPFWLKRSFENSSSVRGKFTLCATLTENEFGEILKSYPWLCGNQWK